MRIFLVGGGTGGPTAPLLAVAEAVAELKKGVRFFFIGSKTGPENLFLKSEKIKMAHLTIPAGKWRRYFSLLNILDMFKTVFGFVKSLYLIRKHKPNVIFGAGSYVQVPLSWAGFVMRVPVVIHQQDFKLLLSTKLTAPLAKKITVAFAVSGKNLPQFSGLFRNFKSSKVVVTGNPVRRDILKGSKTAARKKFSLNDQYPTILVIGGGTGAAALNQKIFAALPELVKYVQVIHLTRGKADQLTAFKHPHYHPYDFLGVTDLADAYAAADVVISRAGMSTISELAALGKPAVLVPLPDSPQELNARLLAWYNCVAAVPQSAFEDRLIVQLVRKILWDSDIQQAFRHNIRLIMPHSADKKIAKLILEVAQHG